MNIPPFSYSHSGLIIHGFAETLWVMRFFHWPVCDPFWIILLLVTRYKRISLHSVYFSVSSSFDSLLMGWRYNLMCTIIHLCTLMYTADNLMCTICFSYDYFLKIQGSPSNCEGFRAPLWIGNCRYMRILSLHLPCPLTLFLALLLVPKLNVSFFWSL